MCIQVVQICILIQNFLKVCLTLDVYVHVFGYFHIKHSLSSKHFPDFIFYTMKVCILEKVLNEQSQKWHG